MDVKTNRFFKVMAMIMLFVLSATSVLLFSQKAPDAYQAYSYKIIGELYNHPENVQQLYDIIAWHRNGTYSEVIEQAKNEQSAEYFRYCDIRKRKGQDLQVKFGGRVWHVCYLSTDKDGNPILTLMLNKDDEIVNGKIIWSYYHNNYNNDTNLLYPNNMYSISYIRAYINNQGRYTSNGMILVDYVPRSDNLLEIFTNDEAEGSLTDVIVKPSAVDWQANENACSILGFNYSCPNESYSPSAEEKWYPGYNISQHELYSDWQDDYLWLPSLSEIGYDNNHNGIFNFSRSQRDDCSWCWTRSGYSYDIDYAFYTQTGYQYDMALGYYDFYYRPALHINLAAPELAASTTLAAAEA